MGHREARQTITMTDISTVAVRADGLLAKLGEWWEHPQPDCFTGMVPSRIAALKAGRKRARGGWRCAASSTWACGWQSRQGT